MILNRAGRETAHFPYTADVDVTAENVEVNLNGTWWDAEVTPTEITLLVAGPDAVGNPAGTAVLALGQNRALVRFPDSPEVVIRGGGVIFVVDD